MKNVFKDNRRYRILVIRAGRLGDTIWASSVIEPLRAEYGQELEIDLLLMENMAGLFAHDPRIRKVFSIRHRGLPNVLSQTKRDILAEARRHPYSLAIDLETGTDFKGFLRVLAAEKKVFAGAGAPRGVTHVVEDIRTVLSQCISPKFLPLAEPSLAAPPALPHQLLGTDYVVIHPGNSHIARGKANLRAWPLPHWRRLGQLLLEQWPRLGLLGSSSD